MSDRRKQARAVLFSVIMVLSVIAVGASVLSGAAAAQQSTADFNVSDGFNQNVSIGSEPAELNRISLEDKGGTVFGNGETSISFTEDNGVTWENVERAVYIDSEVSTSISQDGKTLTISTEESSSDGERLRLINPEVNVASDAEVGNVSAEVDYFIGTTTVDGLLNLSKPELTASEQAISLGSVDEPFDSGTINISTQSDAGEIGSEVVLTSAPDDGFTWNTSNISADEIYNSSASDLSAGTSDATISESEIRIPITDGPSSAADTNVSFDASNLTVDVAGDAVNTTFGAAVVAANGNSDVVLNQTYDVNSTAETAINVNSPNSIPIGSVNQSISGNDVAINVTDTEGTNIGDGTNVTISTDSQYVSFNETQFNDTDFSGDEPTTPAIQDGDITIGINSESAQNNYIELNSTTVDVASDAPNGTEVNLTATTQSSTGAAEVTVTNTTSRLVLRTPKAQFNDTDNVELFTDNQGVTTPGNVEVANITINATTDDQFGVGENVTVEFADTSAGVTFNGSEGDFDITGTSDPVVVADDGSSLEFNVTSALGPSDQLNISNTSYDVEADAQNVSLDVTVPTNVSDVSVEFDGQYTVTQANATAVNNVTDDSVTQQVGETAEVTFNVTSNNLDRALSTDNQSFAGAETELNLSSSPDAFEGTLSDVVSSQELTTDSEGKGGFNFSSDTTGDYTIYVNESTTDNGHAFDFTVSSGNVSDITVEGTENAFSGGASGLSDNEQTAVYKVDLLDSEGNLVTRDDPFEFRVLPSGQTSEIIGLSDELDDDSGGSANVSITPGGNNAGPLYNATSSSDNNVFQYNATDDTTNEQGTFYIYVANDLAEDIDVQVVPRGPSSDIASDTGTATFFNSVDTVTLDTPSSLSVSENVNATATAQTSDGTTIEVPRLTASFSSDNGTVVTVENSIDTDTSGVATGNITADAAGVSNLTATVDSTESESQSITVSNDTTVDTGSLTFNDQTLAADNTVTVEDVSTGQPSTVVVTYANNNEEVVAGTATADNLAGENVSVEIQDTGGFPGDHTAHVFNTSDLPSDLSIGDDATPVVDAALDAQTANITQQEDAPAYYTLKLPNSIADRDVQTTTISTFSTHRQSGSTALLPRSVYRYTRTHTGGLR